MFYVDFVGFVDFAGFAGFAFCGLQFGLRVLHSALASSESRLIFGLSARKELKSAGHFRRASVSISFVSRRSLAALHKHTKARPKHLKSSPDEHERQTAEQQSQSVAKLISVRSLMINDARHLGPASGSRPATADLRLAVNLSAGRALDKPSSARSLPGARPAASRRAHSVACRRVSTSGRKWILELALAVATRAQLGRTRFACCEFAQRFTLAAACCGHSDGMKALSGHKAINFSAHFRWATLAERTGKSGARK